MFDAARSSTGLVTISLAVLVGLLLAIPPLPGTSTDRRLVPWATAAGHRAGPISAAPLGAGSSTGCAVYLPRSASFSISPFNTTTGYSSGPIPFTIRTHAIVQGGTPPYTLNWSFGDGSPVVSSGGSVNHTYRYPGIFEVSLLGNDSSTSSGGGGWAFEMGLGVQTWGSGGPNPVNITSNRTSGLVPLSVTYSANVAGVPAGATYRWGVYPYHSGYSAAVSIHGGLSAVANFTEPGWATAFLTVYYPNGTEYALGSAQLVHVEPRVNLSIAASATSGTSPFNVTFWGNVTSLTGGDYSGFYRIEWDFGDEMIQGFSVNGSKVQHTYGSAATGELGVLAAVVDPGGVMLAIAWVALRVDWNASIPLPTPTLSLSVSPSNGSAPFQVNGTNFASGGQSPYDLNVMALGPATAGGYGPCIVLVQNTSWDGTRISWNHTLNTSGDYLFYASITDSVGSCGTYCATLASITVGPKAAAPHMVVKAGTSVSMGTDSASVRYLAQVSGGTPPYTIQWAFGDGAFGSSTPGVAVNHRYLSPGAFTPGLTVTDSAGQSFVTTFGPIEVGETPTSPYPALAGLRTVSPILLIGVAVLVLGAWGTLRIRQSVMRRQGRRWMRELETEASRRDSPELRR